MANRKPCLVCGATEGPAIFSGEPYCSDDHRKALPPLFAAVDSGAVAELRRLAEERLAAEERRCFETPGVHAPDCKPQRENLGGLYGIEVVQP